SDAALLRKAFAQYRSLANDLLAKLHEVAPDHVPELKIPPARSKKLKTGTMYFYPLPRAWGLDPQVLPNGGLSDKVGVLTASEKHSERLLTATPLKVSGGPLADSKRKMAQAVYLNWEGMVDTLTPWVELGARLALSLARLRDEGGEAPAWADADNVLKHARTVLEVLKVIRKIGRASCRERGELAV